MATPIDIAKDFKAGTTQFIKALEAVYDKELAAKIKEEGKGAKLTPEEISRLRNHPDLGLWNANGKPISVANVRAHFKWRDANPLSRSKKTPLRVTEVKPKEIQGYTRPYLESQKSITREAQRWIKRLNGEAWRDHNGKLHPATGISSWPPGLTEKNIFHEIEKSAKETGDYNAKLAAETGFSFQKGHGWGVMGPANKRTWVVPYHGSRMEGHFTFRNVAPQPSGSSLPQLLHPFWNSIIPNVPSRYSKHGVQVSSAEELKWAGGGGQGWSGTMADILLRATPNANIDDFDQLPLDQKAYVLFGDPDKGGGPNPEARYFEIKNGQWDNVKRRIAPFAATSVKESGPVKRSWIDPKLLGVGTLSTSTLVDLMKNVKAGQLISPFIGPEDLLDENVLGNIGEGQTRIEQGEPWKQVVKEEGADIATGFKDQLLTTGGMFTAFAGLTKLAPGAAAVGGTALGYVAPPLLAIGAWKGIDAYQKARGKKTLTEFTIDDLGPFVNAAKEGDALTSIPGDNTLGSSLKENKISGGGLVKYQTGTEWTTDQDENEEATPTYDYAPSLQLRGV